MTNLKPAGKRLYFKIIFHIIVISTIVFFNILTLKDNIDKLDQEKYKQEKLQMQQDSLMQVYEQAKDSMEKANLILFTDLEKTNDKLDSITKKQAQLNLNYEEEINIIRNATLLDHNNWFYAKLDSIKRFYKPDGE